MRSEERKSVTDQLTGSEVRLLALVQGLDPAQWEFRESPERWSIAEIVEHLAVFEEFIRAAVMRALAKPEETEKIPLAAEKEALVLGLAQSRGSRLQAREATRPAGRWTNGAESIAEFRRARAQTLEFVATADGNLRGHFFPHIAFGDLDCYQWLVAVGQHTLRHCLQIEEILGNAEFPRS